MDDFFDLETENRIYADSHVTTKQADLQPGDFCKREHASGIVIYSEILDPVASLLDGRTMEQLDEWDLEEVEDTRDIYSQPHMKNYRFTRSYSVCCPRGELGDLHVVGVTPISKEEFLEAVAKLLR